MIGNSHPRLLGRLAALATLTGVAAWAGCSTDETGAKTTLGGSGGATTVVSTNAAASSTFATSVGAGGAPATFSCNPVTNEGCSATEACDTDYEHLAFVCYSGDASLALCTPCGPAKAYCKSGSSCVGGLCLKYCCTDADCGTGATCDTKMLPKFGSGQVGLCRVFPEPGAGGGGGGGAGGAGGATAKDPEPDCNAPMEAPSLGSCVPKLGN